MAGVRQHRPRSPENPPQPANQFLAINAIKPPPRFLLGVTLLFWGLMTDRIAVAIPLALIVESAHWLRLRWNFDQHACIRAWQLAILSAGAMAVVLWLDGDRITALHRIISWLPALFVPVQFVQSFGLHDSMPLSTFSFFARQRQLRNERLGLRDASTRINFGNIYFVSGLIAAMLGPKAGTFAFLPGLMLLVGWALLASKQTRWLPLAIALGISGCFAVAGQSYLTKLYERAVRYQRGGDAPSQNANMVDTAIGALGEIKQSSGILWRLNIPQGQQAPVHLRTANFNRYSGGRWSNERARNMGRKSDFISLDEQAEGNNYYIFRSQEEQPDPPASLPHFTMRGAVQEEDKLPLPGDTAAIGGFALDSVLHNSLGTIRIIPKNSVISGTVRWQHHPQLEYAPMEADLFVPPTERAAIRAIVEELRLAEAPTVKEQMRILDGWFRANFAYSRYLTIQPISGKEATSAMSRFLTAERRGHCEYFATATALILRAANVPTRYSIGFLVNEKSSPDAYVLRGTHAHAWCRLWDAETSTWLDFDTTPPDWVGLEGRREASSQWLSDLYLSVREDFALWRTDPDNRAGLTTGMSIIGVIAFIFIGRRLWKSKHVVAGASRHAGPVPAGARTPLHDLEPLARKVLGPRPVGLTFSRWVLGLRPSLGDPGQLDEAIRLHQQLRFDPQPPAESPVEKLRMLVGSIKTGLKP